jgi:uncharacterized protein
MFQMELSFSAELASFLHRNWRSDSFIRRDLTEKTAVKDVIEACGVPHTEVDLIVASDSQRRECQPVNFDWLVQMSVSLEIFGVPAPSDVSPAAPRLQVRACSRFIADGHLGKLARNLRLLGLDTAYDRDADDRHLLAIMIAEKRALLTRDRRLLMHSIVRHGYCPRSSDAEEQTREVLRRFALVGSTLPSLQFLPRIRAQVGRSRSTFCRASHIALLRLLPPLHGLRRHLLGRYALRQISRKVGAPDHHLKEASLCPISW